MYILYIYILNRFGIFACTLRRFTLRRYSAQLCYVWNRVTSNLRNGSSKIRQPREFVGKPYVRCAHIRISSGGKFHGERKSFRNLYIPDLAWPETVKLNRISGILEGQFLEIYKRCVRVYRRIDWNFWSRWIRNLAEEITDNGIRIFNNINRQVRFLNSIDRSEDFRFWKLTLHLDKKKTSFRRKLDSPKIQHPLIFPIFALGIRESFTYIPNTRVCSNTRKIIKPRQKNQLPAQHVRNFSSYICE